MKPHGRAEYKVIAAADHVEAWSTTRLQFEPKGWQLDFRRELRAALAPLRSDSGFLSATYMSPVADRCDVENILFYNVGSGFAATTRNGLRFERSYQDPPGPPAPMQALHYHRYMPSVSGEPFSYWRPRELIARFSAVRLRRLSADTKVSEVWAALRQATVETATLEALPSARDHRCPMCAVTAGAVTKARSRQAATDPQRGAWRRRRPCVRARPARRCA